MRTRIALVLIAGLILSASATSAFIRPAAAQVAQTQLLINWQAATYAPQEFKGKVMPTIDSQITASVDLFDRGRRIDLSGQRIFWYLNDALYQGGPGMTRINFNAPHFVGTTSVQVRVSIPDYGSGPSRSIPIPVVPPEAVMQTSGHSLAANAAPFSLQAVPYFFNIQSPSELQFLWTLRDRLVGNQSLFIATRQAASEGSNARLELQVINPARPIERIVRSLTIFTAR